MRKPHKTQENRGEKFSRDPLRKPTLYPAELRGLLDATTLWVTNFISTTTASTTQVYMAATMTAFDRPVPEFPAFDHVQGCLPGQTRENSGVWRIVQIGPTSEVSQRSRSVSSRWLDGVFWQVWLLDRCVDAKSSSRCWTGREAQFRPRARLPLL